MRAAVIASVMLSAHLAGASGPGAIIVPPTEVDMGVGPTLGNTPAVVGPSAELLAGIHWASLYWKPTDFDVGVGYVGVWRGVVPNYAVRSTVPVDQVDNVLHLDGAYFDVAYTLERHPHWRTWLAARVEYLASHVNGQTEFGHGVALRIATEVYTHTVGAVGDRKVLGVIAGTLAFGFYVEGSHRSLAPELGPNALTAGFSVRVPFIAGIGG
jgi:hypothetical protein